MRLSSSDKGALVALANLATVALCTAIMVEMGGTVKWRLLQEFTTSGYILGLIVADLAIMPALLVGCGLGWLAAHLPGSRWYRFAVLSVASFGAVAVFGALVGWVQLIPLAAIPTLVWTSRLEVWTREDERLPAARTA